MKDKLVKIIDFAAKAYDDANCKYDNNNYFVHVKMVVDNISNHEKIFLNKTDFEYTLAAGYLHDVIEDAKITYNDILKVASKDVADIVLAVTDVPGRNRLMRHLLTMNKTVNDYRAIILKLCDILANTTYSKNNKNSMFDKYVQEYQYRKPIFQQALKWYSEYLSYDALLSLWIELDNAHDVWKN